MSDYNRIKVSNASRTAKRERKEDQRAKDSLTPKKLIDKSSTINTFYRLEEKYGYDYNYEDNKTMKWQKQEFQEKMVKYLGNKTFVPKRSRMDKIKIKEEINFKPTMNPLIRIFNRVNNKLEKGLLWDGLSALRA